MLGTTQEPTSLSDLHQAARAYKHVTMATYQKTSTNQIAPLTEALKVHHIHNNLGLPIAEDFPQSQFVGLCEMNTLQSMEIRAHM